MPSIFVEGILDSFLYIKEHVYRPIFVIGLFKRSYQVEFVHKIQEVTTKLLKILGKNYISTKDIKTEHFDKWHLNETGLNNEENLFPYLP